MALVEVMFAAAVIDDALAGTFALQGQALARPIDRFFVGSCCDDDRIAIYGYIDRCLDCRVVCWYVDGVGVSAGRQRERQNGDRP